MAGAARDGGRGAGLRAAAVVTAAALLCLGAVLLAGALGPVALSGDGLLDRLAADAPSSPGRGAAAPEDETAGDERPVLREADGIPLEVVLSMAAAVVAGALLARSLLRARRAPPAPDDEDDPDEGVPTGAADLVDAVAGAARAGLGRLDDPTTGATDAVLACWVALEAAGGRAGSGRSGPDTPTDFADRLVRAVPGLDRAVLDGLRTTYSRVRFGPAGAGPDDVARARAALETLLDVLAPAGAGARR